MKNKKGQCQLCEREGVDRTFHHLTPREEGGAHLPTAALCIPCHKQIHALYTNAELADRLSTIEELMKDQKVRQFIKWIRKRPAQTLIRTKKSADRKRQSRR
ncbi:HNH endonuclease [Bacillus solitudinis]|uniref:HNH endonuclease n=1 Tax=Bacillus solitudinis TaxID=2014074 RepID=UPI000C246974|nr:HNH endonuclease [Bacillus solitudinis]